MIVFLQKKKQKRNFIQKTKKKRIKKRISLLRLQILKFAPYHLFHCFVGGREQTHQGRQNVDQLGQVFEDISLFVVFERLLATGCLFSALQAELHNHPKSRIFHWQLPQLVLNIGLSFNLVYNFFGFTFAGVAFVIMGTFCFGNSFVFSF